MHALQLLCSGAHSAAAGYESGLQCSGDACVTAVITTPGLGGLSESDFILAAKLDVLPLADLVVPPRKRTTYY